jgi:hypothetical protein
LPSQRTDDAIAPDSIASGRAGFRQRYEAHRQRQAADAARDEMARDLVRQWDRLTDDYSNALPGLEVDPSFGNARARLVQFGQTLEKQPEAVTALRERGSAFGVEKDSSLAWVVAHQKPAQAVIGLMDTAESDMRRQLTIAAEQEALRQTQERNMSRDHGMSL